MLSDNMKEVAKYFNNNWQHYKSYVAQNKLCHNEMFALLNQFLHQHVKGRPISFVDVGCGDGSIIKPVLQDNLIKNYIGIDIAEEVIKMAPPNLAQLDCEKQFILESMITAIKHLPSSVDIIFSSYTVHHLSYQEKFNFIQDCKNKLASGGFFLMIDGILDENQTRNQWLHAYEEYYREIFPNITAEELKHVMEHSYSSDYPENIHTFERISQIQGWKNFHIVVKIGLLAFLVFEVC
ncbi:class I SAM-dependent methyltransferase [Legionella sp.]|uniref:class I SAM-dependent methyltransferase n=1 Tax=Legionella sp. TaxID=459 RepID=UPI003CC1012A